MRLNSFRKPLIITQSIDDLGFVFKKPKPLARNDFQYYIKSKRRKSKSLKFKDRRFKKRTHKTIVKYNDFKIFIFDEAHKLMNL